MCWRLNRHFDLAIVTFEKVTIAKSSHYFLKHYLNRKRKLTSTGATIYSAPEQRINYHEILR